MAAGGILLTGGASRRMGVDKATLEIGGETLAARAARALSAACAPLVEVGLGVSGLPALREDPPGSGPLAALVAGADALDLPSGGAVVLLACDLPLVDVPLLRLLVEWPGSTTLLPVAGGREQYVCARYGPQALDLARELVARGERALQRLAELEHELLREEVWREVAPADAFRDLDTPEDLGRFTTP